MERKVKFKCKFCPVLPILNSESHERVPFQMQKRPGGTPNGSVLSTTTTMTATTTTTNTTNITTMITMIMMTMATMRKLKVVNKEVGGCPRCRVDRSE